MKRGKPLKRTGFKRGPGKRKQRRAALRGAFQACDPVPVVPGPGPVAVALGHKVAVSTGRRAGNAQQKVGDMISPSLRARIKAGEYVCAHACARMAIEPQHYPTTGANGAVLDLLSYPTCRPCHDRCDTSPLHGGYTDADKAVAHHSFWTYLARRQPELLRAVLRELAPAP